MGSHCQRYCRACNNLRKRRRVFIVDAVDIVAIGVGRKLRRGFSVRLCRTKIDQRHDHMTRVAIAAGRVAAINQIRSRDDEGIILNLSVQRRV